MSTKAPDVERCGEWLGTVFSLPTYVIGEGDPYRPQAIMWFEPETTTVVGNELVRPGDELAQAVKLFRAATRAPLTGSPRIPHSVRVASPELGAALRASLKHVEVVVAPTPELDPVEAALCEHMREGDPEGDERVYLTPGMLPEHVAAFFEAAARLFEAKPWDVLPVDTFVAVACDALGIDAGALTVVGRDGLSRGFALFQTANDVVDYLACISDEELRTSGGLPEHIMLAYRPRTERSTWQQQEVEAHGWRVAGEDAYPHVAVIDSDLVARPLSPEELAGVTAVMSTLVGLVTAEDLESAWTGEDEIAVDARVPTPSGDIDVELSVPAAELEELLAEATGRDLLLEKAEELVESMGDVGMDPDEVAWGAVLSQTAVEQHGTLLHQLSPDELAHIVFDVIPADVPCAPDQAKAIIAGVRALLAYAATLPEPGRAPQLLASLSAGATKRLEQRLADPRNFGTAKALIMAGTLAGYDMSTEEGIAQFVADSEAGLAVTVPKQERAAKKRSAKKQRKKAKK